MSFLGRNAMTDNESTLPVPTTAWIYPTVIHAVLGLTVLGRLLANGPRWAKTFGEFNLELPATTKAFVEFSLRVEDNLALVAVVLPGLVLLDALVLWMLGGWRRAEGKVWFWFVLVILLLTWLVLEVSFLLPAFKLREALSR
jgi:hypothetical protein